VLAFETHVEVTNISECEKARPSRDHGTLAMSAAADRGGPNEED
jgi:hypothetical protein